MTTGLTPKPHSSGGKEKLGKIIKMGNRVAKGCSDRWRNHWQLRRLLYLGAPCWKHAFGMTAQTTVRRHTPAGEDWLWNMLQRKPVKLVEIACAGRMVRKRPVSLLCRG